MVVAIYDARSYPRGGVRGRGMDPILDWLVEAEGKMVPVSTIAERMRTIPELMNSTLITEGIPAGSYERYISKYVGFIVKWCAGEVVAYTDEHARRRPVGYALINWHQFEQQVFPNGVKRWRLKKAVHDRLIAKTVLLRKAAEQKAIAASVPPAEQESLPVPPTAPVPLLTAETSSSDKELTMAELDEAIAKLEASDGVVESTAHLDEKPEDAEAEIQSVMLPETDASEMDEGAVEDGTEGIVQEAEADVPVLTAPATDAQDSSDGAEITLPPAETTTADKPKGGRFKKRAA